MTQPTDHPIAVLTGDLVRSGLLSDSEIGKAFQCLEASAARQERWFGAPLHFSRHRGDGWQVALLRPHTALRSAIAFRAALRALGEEFDSYIGIATGTAPTPPGPDLNAETSAPYTRSGETLEDLKSSRITRMAHADLGPMDAATILADRLIRQWTPIQAETVSAALAPDDPATHAEIAETLGKSRQAVTKALKAAGFDHLSLALETLDRSPPA